MRSFAAPTTISIDTKTLESNSSYNGSNPENNFLEALRLRLQFMEWPVTHTIIVGLAILDFLICELSLLETLFDTASPSFVSTTKQMVYLLATDSQAFTMMRMILFWSSMTIRMVFLIELFLRVLSRTPSAMYNSSFELLDGLIIILLFSLKFGLYSRDAFVADLIVVVRIGRIYKVFHIFNLQMHSQFENEKNELINAWQMQMNEKEKRTTAAFT
ncbi:hypothetical protein BATDEDRAFT_23552 [Batrachochytrium dendrobatidis JAM81]|uniref:Hydrogen voltage-gated channel 1 n=2 Tax=Batrachochytrium dendrobatidis TaxID=109871 RepID=F4NXM8_BATDJ|nr:uncharacterized protein BATDEDRAFT_23552 [Batrachochytrium dendrobatidis JAM81]EGF81873.1 hypothetical protein BATDEDRAFT_23552 [Batrachochytrium dendrobatidis JAM81]KAJ8324570.1 hypothetical protein O5D80_006815 [Batrachochytrium dendrobatidis]OAJ40505.1 hypothetical protein BDEG_24230 [Batrachochytrium dendrobatidis JEL423]|eukprot:XP_006677315.1 hypothetical protein BATDEDRAFT_23552 [Batrachochytrium dendrobatidis JAM81]